MSAKGVPKSAAHRAALSEAAKRRYAKLTAEQRREAAKHLRDADVRAKAAESLTGRSLSDEHRAAIARGQLGHAFRGPFELSDETRAKLSAAKRGVPKSAEHAAKISAAHRARWQTMTDDERAAWMRRTRRNPSSLSTLVSDELTRLGIEHVCEFAVGVYSVDVFVPSLDLCIECDGTYWHSLPKQQRIDAEKTAALIAAGYRVERLPEVEIRANVAAVLRHVLT